MSMKSRVCMVNNLTYHIEYKPADENYHDSLVQNDPTNPYKNAFEIFTRTVEKHGNNNFLGRRFLNEDNQLGNYEWMTYAQAYQVAQYFGSELINRKLCETIKYPEEVCDKAKELRLLGFFTVNCIEWFLAEQACNAYNITLCPLYDTLGQEALQYIFEKTKLVTMLIGYENLETFLSVVEHNGAIKDTINVKNLILVNCPMSKKCSNPKEQYKSAIERCNRLNLNLYSWVQLVKSGRNNVLDPTPGDLTDINTLCYTSGTTSAPKGILITNANIVAMLNSSYKTVINTEKYFTASETDVVLSYLPLAHVFERAVCQIILSVGASIGVYSGDLYNLLNDIKCLNPTIFCSVPRLFKRINDKININVSQKRSMLANLIFNMGLSYKRSSKLKSASNTNFFWDWILFNKIKTTLGTRLKYMISGGAAINDEIATRMSLFFGVPLLQGYGLSETFGPCFLSSVYDTDISVGGCWPSVEWKLRFTNADKTIGELLLRGPSIFCGYFLNKEETEKCFDKDGWFYTGDIATINKKTNSIKIIDRCKNIFKLSQGEYVAPDRLQSILSAAQTVSQIYIDGMPGEPYLVAVVYPDMEGCQAFFDKINVKNPCLEDYANDTSFKQFILNDLNNIAKQQKLKKFEHVVKIHITTEPMTVENNLLTPTNKLKRNECKDKYYNQIIALYKED